MEVLCFYGKREKAREFKAMLHAGIGVLLAAVVIVLVFWK